MSRCAAAVAAVAGAGVLVGWAVGAETLKRVMPGLVAMNPATAAAFVLAGTSLWVIHGRGEMLAGSRRLARACASVVVLVGLAKLLACVGGWDAGVDRWLFHASLTTPRDSSPNRMAPNTALNFVLIGLALLWSSAATTRSRFAARTLGLVSGMFSALAVVGYINGVTSLNGVASFIPMALHTALTFLVLSAGVALADPFAVAEPINAGSGDVTCGGDWMPTSLERKVSLGFGAAVFMLCVIGVVSYKSIQQFIVNAGWYDHTRLVLATIAEASNDATDVEAIARGFVITGNEPDVPLYEAATTRLQSKLHALRELTLDNPRQQERLDRIGPFVSAKMAAMQQAMDLRRRKGLEASGEFVREGGGTRATDAMRGIFDEMKGEEERLLKDRSAAEQVSAGRTITIISVSSALAFVLVAAAGWMIRRDIIARRKAEAALREAEERFRLLIEGVRDYVIIMLDPGGRITSWNAAAERIKGYKAAEIVGQHFSRFYTAEDLRQGKPARELKMATETGRYEEEGWRVRKDGSTFWANVVITAVRDGQGTLRGFAKVTRDVTARKRAEDDIRKLNAAVEEHAAQLEATNKELEAFSYSVSHDLRAPLRSIDGFSQALLEDYSEKLGEDGKDSLQRVRAATQRMGQLIDDMLNLSRVTRADMKPEPVDLTAMANSVVAELGKAAPERAVEIVVQEGLTARGDARLLRVVLDNLIGNAWKFTGRREGARIEVGRSADGAFYVRDNGAGFDMAYAHKLFGAFQRLHAMNEFSGTGIGLATVQRIVHRHGGRAWAEGAVGRGATFCFTIAPERASLHRAA